MVAKTYKRTNEFTAQGINVRALMLLFEQLEADKESDKNLVPIVVFTAFAIESYLNSIGSRNINFWEEIERIPWRKKIEILHKISGKKPEWGKDPLQLACDVFRDLSLIHI